MFWSIMILTELFETKLGSAVRNRPFLSSLLTFFKMDPFALCSCYGYIGSGSVKALGELCVSFSQASVMPCPCSYKKNIVLYSVQYNHWQRCRGFHLQMIMEPPLKGSQQEFWNNTMCMKKLDVGKTNHLNLGDFNASWSSGTIFTGNLHHH